MTNFLSLYLYNIFHLTQTSVRQIKKTGTLCKTLSDKKFCKKAPAFLSFFCVLLHFSYCRALYNRFSTFQYLVIAFFNSFILHSLILYIKNKIYLNKGLLFLFSTVHQVFSPLFFRFIFCSVCPFRAFLDFLLRGPKTQCRPDGLFRGRSILPVPLLRPG